MSQFWVPGKVGPASGAIITITGDSGGPETPDSVGNFNLVGSTYITTVGSSHTETFNLKNYSATPTASYLSIWDSNANLSANRFIPASNRQVLSGTKTIASGDPQYQYLEPNGAGRNVVLPTAVTNMLFIIKNIGSTGNVLTVEDSTSTPITGGAIANGVTMGFYYDGTAWQIV